MFDFNLKIACLKKRENSISKIYFIVDVEMNTAIFCLKISIKFCLHFETNSVKSTYKVNYQVKNILEVFLSLGLMEYFLFY